MFEWDKGIIDEKVSRICVFVLLPRYLMETTLELRKAIQQNKNKIDGMVQAKIETEMLTQKLGISFHSFVQSKCTLRPDYILEYMFDLKSIA